MAGRRASARRRPELSQHFLRRGALAASLVERSSVKRSDTVLEVGAGTGALTRELARRCRRLVAVEYDPSLCEVLRDRFGSMPGVEVVEADFLTTRLPDGEYVAFGNIPFSRTAAIVRRLTDASNPPRDAYLVVQLEAAQRFAGQPYGPETRASLLLKPWWHAEIVRRLRGTEFEPPTPVECALLWLARRERPLTTPDDGRLYLDFIIASFGRRGQSVQESLRGLLTTRQIVRLARDLQFDADGNPSGLDFARWLGLYRFFSLSADRAARERVRGHAASARRHAREKRR